MAALVIIRSRRQKAHLPGCAFCVGPHRTERRRNSLAVVKLPQSSTIAVKLQKGVTTSGSPAYVTRNYIAKSTATDQDLFDVAQALVGLQSYSLAEISRVDNASLINQ